MIDHSVQVDRFGSLFVEREPGDEGDVGVDRVADRDTGVALDGVVVGVHPVGGFVRIDERERQGADVPRPLVVPWAESQGAGRRRPKSSA